ncbi:MAG: MBL fold metallo-hydrolase [Bacteroidales bacterium]|nr:MBL fold metallo-hydrolase [Bacteroidales bacterium]
MQVKYNRFVNSQFTSNTYVLYTIGSEEVWLVDPGDVAPVWQWMKESGKTKVKGMLLTHTHFDHCYGVNEVLDRFPDALLFVANEQGANALKDAKLNNSFFTGKPFVIEAENNLRYFQSDFELWDEVAIHAFFTPGHSEDSVCFLIEKLLFTGDTLIHNLRTITKLRGGNTVKLRESLDFLQTLNGRNCHVCPGHNEEFELDGYDLSIAVKMNNN